MPTWCTKRPLMLLLLSAAGLGCESADLTLPPSPGHTVTISGMSPVQGYAGDLVHLTGVGFGANASSVEVLFSGGTARPEDVSADGTSLDVRVPLGISDGPISVASPIGRGTSTASFNYLGAGHVQQGAFVNSRQLASNLTALTNVGGTVWALAAEPGMIVSLWSSKQQRLRLPLTSKVVDMALQPDVNQRVVFITASALYAGSIASFKEGMADLMVDLSSMSTALSRVIVANGGTRALVFGGSSLISLDLTQANPTPQAITVAAPITGLKETTSGVVAIAYQADTAATVELRAADTLELQGTATLAKQKVAGPMATYTPNGGEQLLAVSTTDGHVAYLKLSTMTFASAQTDLITGEAPADLFATADGSTLLASLPKSGRLSAVDTGSQAVTWSLSLGGQPGRIAPASNGDVAVADLPLNQIIRVHPATQSTLGAVSVPLGLGSVNPRLGIQLQPGIAYLLAQKTQEIIAMRTADISKHIQVFLAPGPIAFTASADGQQAIVAHSDGSLGLAQLSMQRSVETPLCPTTSVQCPPDVASLLDMRLLDSSTLLLVTPSAATVYDLPDLTMRHQRLLSSGEHFVAMDVTPSGVGLAWSDGMLAAFEEYASVTGLGGTPTHTETEMMTAGGPVTPLGAAGFRRADLTGDAASQWSLGFFFTRPGDATSAAWVDVPDRTDLSSLATQYVGQSPLFSPDGRQVIGIGTSEASTKVSISAGDIFSGSGLMRQAVLDTTATPTAVGYSAGGDQAFVVTADDTVSVIE